MSEYTPYVLVIGGANVDFFSTSTNPLVWNDSNPGIIKSSLGGVGRNIAENLARLSIPTKLLSLVGDDAQGAKIIEETKASGVDMSAVDVLQHQRTSTYFSIMNNDDMAVAIADMEIVDLLTPQKLEFHLELINQAEIVIIDTNLSTQALTFLLMEFPQKCFLVDCVSVTKVAKIKSLLAHIDTLKPNRLEAEYLTGITIKSVDDARLAVDRLLELGVKQVFISLGEDGIVYGRLNERLHSPSLPTKVVNATGAGDSMVASIAYGMMKQLSPSVLLPFTNATASLTLMAETTICPDLSVEAIENLLRINQSVVKKL